MLWAKSLQAQKRYKNSKKAALKKLFTNAEYFGVLNPWTPDWVAIDLRVVVDFWYINLKLYQILFTKVDASFAPAPIFLILCIGISINLYTLSVLKMSSTFTVFST